MKKIFLFLTTALMLASCTGKLTEKVEVAYPNGKPQTVRVYDRRGRCVKETELYPTGQVKMSGPMKNDKMEGEWASYFPDGRTQSVGTFKDGKRIGKATVWQENGNLLHEGFYKDGKHVGKWKYYDEQGILIKEVDYGEGE